MSSSRTFGPDRPGKKNRFLCMHKGFGLPVKFDLENLFVDAVFSRVRVTQC